MDARVTAMRWMAVSLAVVALVAGTATAGITIETVTVGNPGNTGELSGAGTGPSGYGPDRVCGAVSYTYNIGKYEVTAAQYTAFLNAVAADDTYRLYSSTMWSNDHGCKIQQGGSPGSYTYSVAADYADRPANTISWADAARFCNWLHNGQPTGVQDLTTTEDGSYYLNGANTIAAFSTVSREPDATWVIPSEDEWYKAAYHKNDGTTANYFDYPTSSDSAPGYVNNSGNLSGTGTPFVDGVTDPGNYATYNGDVVLPGGIGSPYYRTEVGEWENSASPYGTFDQGGNVWEWTDTVVSVTNRVARGGYYRDTAPRLNASYRGVLWDALFAGSNTGLRIASVGAGGPPPSSSIPEPGSSVLGVLGLAVLGLRKRRN